MKVLIDADIVVNRVGFTTEDTDHEIAIWRTREMVSNIIRDTESTDYQLYLTADNDVNAFRRKIYPEYKAHRTKPRPKWYNEIRDYLQMEWEAEIIVKLEADDVLAIEQSAAQEKTTIIASIDKDLKQIPGLHYDFVKGEISEVTYLEGIRLFYRQLITGDAADNIKGIPKLGPVKAERILANGENEKEWFDIVRELYSNDDEFLMNGRCLWLWRTWSDDWQKHFERLASGKD